MQVMWLLCILKNNVHLHEVPRSITSYHKYIEYVNLHEVPRSIMSYLVTKFCLTFSAPYRKKQKLESSDSYYPQNDGQIVVNRSLGNSFQSLVGEKPKNGIIYCWHDGTVQ